MGHRASESGVSESVGRLSFHRKKDLRMERRVLCQDFAPLRPTPYNKERNVILEENHAPFRRSHPFDELH